MTTETAVLGALAPDTHPRIVEVRRDLPKRGSGKLRETDPRDDCIKAHGRQS
ncbi:hypothetical protein [Natrinema versiforme]|uniref:AMP-dependent synthetase and ligase n=1 Tax=Natrinema versiforme JCM 10478 TaxID=1227496 RepID=L9XTU5_9EURY|nr:hypothetical protein [Natrinema versiforme]ELY64967.1 AMP-dependent synthetase and ligase [Natrinema versiforme JCM 10478]